MKTAGRRTSAPPVVNTQGHQQRALLREKSKENQLDRNGYPQQDKDLDKSCFDIGQYDAVRCLLRINTYRKLHLSTESFSLVHWCFVSYAQTQLTLSMVPRVCKRQI